MTTADTAAIAIPGKLHVNTVNGHLEGAAELEYNAPFPVGLSRYHPAGSGEYGSGAMQGVVMHTMVGDLKGTIGEFSNPDNGASSHFGVAQGGKIHQFGPIGKGWCAWAQMAGNLTWYSIEFADDRNPANPLTGEQIEAGAQIVECLSAFAGFPLQVTDRPAGRGFGMHRMGGIAWGGHSCPQLADGTGPRAGQRYDIIALAKQIRGAQ